MTSPELLITKQIDSLLQDINRVTHALTWLDDAVDVDQKKLASELWELSWYHPYMSSIQLYPDAMTTLAILEAKGEPLYKLLKKERSLDLNDIQDDTIRRSPMLEIYLTALANLWIVRGDMETIHLTKRWSTVVWSAVGTIVPDSYHIPVAKTTQLARWEISYGDHADVGRDKLKNGAWSDLQVAQKVAPTEYQMIESPDKYFDWEVWEAMWLFSWIVISLGSWSALMWRTVAASNKVIRVYNSDRSQTQLDLGKRNALLDETYAKMY